MNKRQALYVLLLTAAVLAVFGNTLLNGFVYDDAVLTVGNRVYTEFMLERMFFSLGNGLEYLPLRDLTFAIDFAVWGERAFGFHLTNLLIYLANVFAVYYLTVQLCLFRGAKEEAEGRGVDATAFVAALLFAVHPVHSEAVAWVTGRNVLLSGLFFFLGSAFYLAYLRRDRGCFSGQHLGAFICFLCALLSKATSITLPLVFLLFVAFDRKGKRLTRLLQLLPFFALALVFFVLFREVATATNVISQRLTGLGSSSILVKAVTALQIPFFYLWKLAVPVGLSPEYDVEFAGALLEPWALMALGALVALTSAAVVLRNKYPEMLLGFGWFMVTLIPVLNFFTTNPAVADRYAYLPSFGFIYLIAAWSCRHRRRAGIILALTLSGFWSLLAVKHNAVWRADKTFWEYTLKASPRLVKAYTSLGAIYFDEGDYARAFSLLAKSEEFVPASDYYDLFQGYRFMKQGDLPAAINAFRKAYARKEEFIDVLYALGNAYEQSGAYDQAIEMYNKVLIVEEQDFKGFRQSSRLALQRLLKRYEPELAVMREKVAGNAGDLNARGELAVRLDSLGLYDEALNNYLAMERQGLKSWQVFFNTANIYKKLRNYKDAARYYEKSRALNPDYADTLNNLGFVYKRMKAYDRAQEAFEQAVVKNSRYAYAPFNLALLYMETGDRQNALRYFRYTQDRFPELRPMVAPYLKKLQ
jgi:tetratricopeptide (TPR) repeat protein